MLNRLLLTSRSSPALQQYPPITLLSIVLRSPHQVGHQHCTTTPIMKFLPRPSWSIRGKSSPSTSPSRCQVRLVHRCLNSFSSTQNQSSPLQPWRQSTIMFLLLQIAITDVNVFITSTDRISIKLNPSFILINSGKSSLLQFLMQLILGIPSLQTSTTNTMKVYHFKEQFWFKSLLLTFDKLYSTATISPSYIIVHHAKITTPSRSPTLQPQHQWKL